MYVNAAVQPRRPAAPASGSAAAAGSHPSPWPAREEDVRYWPMCVGVLIRLVPIVASKLPGGGTDYGCRADEGTGLNAAGYCTYVSAARGPQACLR